MHFVVFLQRRCRDEEWAPFAVINLHDTDGLDQEEALREETITRLGNEVSDGQTEYWMTLTIRD